ncbi:hypothetical protein A9K55_000671 [Cordyceps militaris]|uniref:Uncharacterized protein n=1 Tax=Cordyceps militaris TaxID=73501 RepID=A0A2H4STL0_CORMI|nr:hypothetical protein A9K55_000671 [Cordyceps militaris]
MGTTARAFVNRLFSDQDQTLLVNLFRAIRHSSDEDAGAKYVKAQGYDLDAGALTKLTSGPDFNLSLAGGTYRFENNPFHFYELFVNSLCMDAHLTTGVRCAVDGRLLPSSTPYHADGQGFFTLVVDDATLKVRFTFEALQGKDVVPSFKGVISHSGKNFDTSGVKYYPWGDVGGPAVPIFAARVPPIHNADPDRVKAAEKAVAKAASTWVAVGFDLMCLQEKESNELFDPAIEFASPAGGGDGKNTDGKPHRRGKGCWSTSLYVIWIGCSSAFSKLFGVKIMGATADAIEKRYVGNESSKITNLVRRAEIDPDVLKKQLQKKVNGLAEDELASDSRERTMESISAYLKTEYEIEVKTKTLSQVKSDFHAANFVFPVELRETFNSACSAKFDLDFGSVNNDPAKSNLRHVINLALDNKVKRMEVPTLEEEVYNLKNKWNARQRDIAVQIGKLPRDLPTEERAKRVQKIKDTYKDELDKLKEEQNRKQREVDAVKEGGENDRKFEERYEKLKRDVKELRNQEIIRQGG